MDVGGVQEHGCEPEDAVGTSCLKKGFSASVAVTVGSIFSKLWIDPSPESSVCGDTVVLVGIIQLLPCQQRAHNERFWRRGLCLKIPSCPAATSALTAAVLCKGVEKKVFLPQQVCIRFVTGEVCALLLQIQPPRQFLFLCRDCSFKNYLGDTRAKTGVKTSLTTCDCISTDLFSLFLPYQCTNGAAGALFCPFASWFLHVGVFQGCPAPVTFPTMKIPDCF